MFYNVINVKHFDFKFIDTRLLYNLQKYKNFCNIIVLLLNKIEIGI